jgi:hypothetical protein
MIGLSSDRLVTVPTSNEILPPQSTTLYDELNTNYTFDPIVGIGTALTNYSTLASKVFKFVLQNQNNNSMLIRFNDKNLSNGLYGNINGFDYDLDLRFLNLDSPTIIYLPLIKSKDKNTNISLNLTIIPNSVNYQGTIENFSNNLTNQNIQINDLILLTSQMNTLENCIYRVSSIAGDSLSVVQENKINSILNYDQTTIFTRACVVDDNGENYFGLKNDNGYNWIQQTNTLKLKDCDFNLIRNPEIINNKIYRNEVSILYSLSIGKVIAISILNGGKTSGIYIIKSFDDQFIYLEPAYSEKLFIHQFCYISQDYQTNQPCIWYVNPSYINKKEIYGWQVFSFSYYSINNILNDPSLWAKQVGGSNDQILGTILYNRLVENKFITSSDNFKIGVKLPSWANNNSVFYGLSIQASYMCEGFI